MCLQSYAEREQGKVVVYTTSMGVVRQTYQRCLQVRSFFIVLSTIFCVLIELIDEQYLRKSC